MLKPDSSADPLAYDSAALDATGTLERPPAPPAEAEEEDLAVHRYILKNRFVLKDLDAGSRALVHGAIGALLVTADTGQHVAPAFESELWPAYGLAFLGAPVIIATAFSTLPWRRRSTPPRAAAESATPA